jgi:two-component system, NarL family, sensor kinase
VNHSYRTSRWLRYLSLGVSLLLRRGIQVQKGTGAGPQCLADRPLSLWEKLFPARLGMEMRFARRTRELDESAIQLQTETLGRQVGEASLVERSSDALQVQDRERRRIARELHDSTAQLLVAISMNLARIQEHVGMADDHLTGMIRDTGELVDNTQNEIRTISYLLHPPLLDDLGLSSALAWYARGFSKRSGVEVTVSVSQDIGRLTRESELALFRIVQEALTNVHRHSQSRTAQIRLTREASFIHLEIADQGCGLKGANSSTMETDDGGLGVGLPGMRERMRLLGGSMLIESSASGTMIKALLPMTSQIGTQQPVLLMQPAVA